MRRHYDDYDDEDEGPYVVIEKRSGGLGTLFVGLAIGAGLALLFAPRSGAETRQQLRRRAERMRDAAENAVDEVTGTVQDTFEAARQRVEEKIDAARDAIETKRDQVQRAVDAGREAAQQARADLERRLAETKAAYNAGAQVARDARAERAAVRAAQQDVSPKSRSV
jgi:gas vesicle protein